MVIMSEVSKHLRRLFWSFSIRSCKWQKFYFILFRKHRSIVRLTNIEVITVPTDDFKVSVRLSTGTLMAMFGLSIYTRLTIEVSITLRLIAPTETQEFLSFHEGCCMGLIILCVKLHPVCFMINKVPVNCKYKRCEQSYIITLATSSWWLLAIHCNDITWAS